MLYKVACSIPVLFHVLTSLFVFISIYSQEVLKIKELSSYLRIDEKTPYNSHYLGSYLMERDFIWWVYSRVS